MGPAKRHKTLDAYNRLWALAGMCSLVGCILFLCHDLLILWDYLTRK